MPWNITDTYILNKSVTYRARDSGEQKPEILGINKTYKRPDER